MGRMQKLQQQSLHQCYRTHPHHGGHQRHWVYILFFLQPFEWYRSWKPFTLFENRAVHHQNFWRESPWEPDLQISRCKWPWKILPKYGFWEGICGTWEKAIPYHQNAVGSKWQRSTFDPPVRAWRIILLSCGHPESYMEIGGLWNIIPGW